jgi:hypothetical protein
MSDLSLEALAQTFQRFAREEVRDASPLYEKLSLSIAEDPEILALAAHARNGERIPNLFFAAVQFLLLNGIKHPVSVFFEIACGPSASVEDPYPEFRSFVSNTTRKFAG